MTATLREVDADVAGQGVWALLRPHGNEAIAPVDPRLEWDGERACFRGTLPGQTEALYDLDVSAQHVPDPSAVRRTSAAA
ncbi:MAG: hypothetical protein ACT4NY_18325 [Pseudonocardiales bacterium]